MAKRSQHKSFVAILSKKFQIECPNFAFFEGVNGLYRGQRFPQAQCAKSFKFMFKVRLKGV